MFYDTQEKKEQFVKKQGSIITFKKPFYPKDKAYGTRRQIINVRFEELTTGRVRIIGPFYNSKWHESIAKLIEALDWEWMDEAHTHVKEVLEKSKY